MKTNKERTAEVFRRVEEYQQKQPVEKETMPAKRKRLAFVAAFLSAVIIASVVLGLTLGLLPLDEKGFNLDKMYIANFENYSALGAGVETGAAGTGSASANSITFANDNNGPAYLIGVDEK